MRWWTRLSDEMGERWPPRERHLYIGLYGWCTCGLEMESTCLKYSLQGHCGEWLSSGALWDDPSPLKN